MSSVAPDSITHRTKALLNLHVELVHFFLVGICAWYIFTIIGTSSILLYYTAAFQSHSYHIIFWIDEVSAIPT